MSGFLRFSLSALTSAVNVVNFEREHAINNVVCTEPLSDSFECYCAVFVCFGFVMYANCTEAVLCFCPKYACSRCVCASKIYAFFLNIEIFLRLFKWVFSKCIFLYFFSCRSLRLSWGNLRLLNQVCVFF